MTILPGSIIGYRKNGLPIRLQAGGSHPLPPENPGAPQPVGNPNQPIIINQPPQGQYFTAEQLEAARQQEKDKLYGRLQTLEEQFTASKTELEQYRQDKESAEKERADAIAAAAAAKKAADEEKLSVKELLEIRSAEIKQQQEAMKADFEVKQAMLHQEQRLFQLQSYIQRRVQEEIAAGNLMEDLVEYVDGTTEEEIETSITKAKEKTAKIFEGAQRFATGASQQPLTPGVSPTGFAPTGPLDNLTGTQQYTPQDIRNMSPKEYAEFRVKAGIASAGNQKGLF